MPTEFFKWEFLSDIVKKVMGQKINMTKYTKNK